MAANVTVDDDSKEERNSAEIALDYLHSSSNNNNGEDAARGQLPQTRKAVPQRVLISPTDAIVSPVSKMLQQRPQKTFFNPRAGSSAAPPSKLQGSSSDDNIVSSGEEDASAIHTASNTEMPTPPSSCKNEEDIDLRVQLSPRPPPCSVPIILGSSSSFRRLVMEQLGWKFSTASPDIDEKEIRDPDTRKMTLMIARGKAAALKGLVDKPAVLITADQVCVFDGDNGEEVREKPISEEQAAEFLRSYSGRSVRTVSALCVTNVETGVEAEGSHESTVFWMEISPTVVDAVIANGTTMSSAGGFTLEDPDLRPLVDRIEGSVDSVYGLPVHLMCDLIKEVT